MRKPNQFRPAVESLEGRRLMAADTGLINVYFNANDPLGTPSAGSAAVKHLDPVVGADVHVGSAGEGGGVFNVRAGGGESIVDYIDVERVSMC